MTSPGETVEKREKNCRMAMAKKKLLDKVSAHASGEMIRPVGQDSNLNDPQIMTRSQALCERRGICAPGSSCHSVWDHAEAIARCIVCGLRMSSGITIPRRRFCTSNCRAVRQELASSATHDPVPYSVPPNTGAPTTRCASTRTYRRPLEAVPPHYPSLEPAVSCSKRGPPARPHTGPKSDVMEDPTRDLARVLWSPRAAETE